MVGWFRRFRPPLLHWSCSVSVSVSVCLLFSSLALSGFACFGPGVLVLVFAPSLFFCVPLLLSRLSSFSFHLHFHLTFIPFHPHFHLTRPDLSRPTLLRQGVRVEHLNRCKTPIILSVNAGGTGVTLVPVPTNTAKCHSDIRGRRPFEVSAKSIILFNCTLWDSVPDGSLQ